MTQPIPDGLICLTFDDGVKSQHSFVAPLLEELEFGGTFYISEGLRFLEDKARYMIQRKALQRLRSLVPIMVIRWLWSQVWLPCGQ